MLAEPAGGPEPEQERLRHDLLYRPGEIQRQQQRPPPKRPDPGQPPRRHQDLRPRPVTLPPPPGNPADRLAPGHRTRPQVPARGPHAPARSPPGGRPPPRPPRPQLQADTLTQRDRYVPKLYFEASSCRRARSLAGWTGAGASRPDSSFDSA